MKTDTKLLHSMRGQQLKALFESPAAGMSVTDYRRMGEYALLCGAQYDTRNLSDKALEEIDTLAGKYLDRIK
jgi:hypothetical protein